jgi:hypothetical protein
MGRWFLPIGLASALLVAGCASPMERRAAHEAQCKSYGFKPGTEGFATCLLKLDEPPPTVM